MWYFAGRWCVVMWRTVHFGAISVLPQLLLLVLRLHLVFQGTFLHNFLSYLRRQSRCQAIISPSHLKCSGLFPGTAVCWMCRSAFEVTWALELCCVSLWKMTSLGFFRQDVLSESGWGCPWFCCLCWKSLWLNSDPAFHKLPCQELPCHHTQSEVSGILWQVLLPFLSICWCCIVSGKTLYTILINKAYTISWVTIHNIL